MEVFIEQLVEKRTAAEDNIKRVLIIAGALVLLALLVVGSMFFPPLMLIGAGVIYFAFVFLTGIGTEYEYILTGDELDVDKISGKRKRKRMVTMKLSGTTAWAKGEVENTGSIPDGAVTVMAHAGLQDALWHIIAKHEGYGYVLLYFSPDLRTAGEINKIVPSAVKIRDLPEYDDDGTEE
jgi:hypothetical protein